MFNKVKYTLVPENSLEDGLLDSAIILSEMTSIISPVILFNDIMDYGLDSIYEDYGVLAEDIKYIDEKHLDSILEEECKKQNNGNCIILNGFDISINDIRNKFAILSKKYDKILSINIVTNKVKYTNFSATVPINVCEEYSDKDWKAYKDLLEKQMEDAIKNEMDYIMNDPFVLKFDSYEDIDSLEDDDNDESISRLVKYLSNEGEENKDEEDFEIFSFENKDGYIEVSKSLDKITISDGVCATELSKSHIQFIIDTFCRLK